MSTNQTEREVPAEIEAAIQRLMDTCEASGENPGYTEWKHQGQAEHDLRHAIIAALEPERELRERCERLRVKLIGRHTDESLGDVEVRFGLSYGDLTDDLTATTSADEGRAG
jgi:hypothetical protein